PGSLPLAPREPARPRQRPRPTEPPTTGASRFRTSSRPYLPQDLPLPIHALVVGAKLTLLDRTPPRLARSKPFHRLSNPIFERPLCLPARPTRELAAIHRVAAIVPRPIFDMTDQSARLPEQPEDRVGDRENVELIPGADIESLAIDVRPFQQGHQCPA